MTLDDLIAEGRALERPCWFLQAGGEGAPVAVWHEATKTSIRRWLTVDAAFYCNVGCRFISVISDHSGGGVVECLDSLPVPASGDLALFAIQAVVLPPIDAVFALGSEKVGSWLAKHGWERDWGYNPNFADRGLVEQYQRAFQSEHPLYLSSGVFAMIGGWHFPFPDDDWEALKDDELLLMTFQDAEPWVEAWRAKDEGFKVIERIT